MNSKKIVAFERFCECCIYRGVELATKKHVCTHSDSDGVIGCDSCPRWKAIDCTEENRVLEEFAKKMLENQREPNPDLAKFLEENLWNLV